MSLRLLMQAAAFALFGKLPGAGDFLRLNLVPGAATALDGWLQRGFAELGDDVGGDGGDGAVWRVAMDGGVAGAPSVAGVMAPSRDAVGRPYPCFALLAAPGAPARSLAAATSWFDGVEAALASAVAPGRSVSALLADLAALGAPGEPEPADFLVKARATPDAALLDVQGGPDPRGEALAAAWEASPPPEGSSLWWRHEGRRTRVVTAAGLPRGPAFAALFPTWATDVSVAAAIG